MYYIIAYTMHQEYIDKLLEIKEVSTVVIQYNNESK